MTDKCDWAFSQLFGEKNSIEVSDVDIVSSIEFDETGEFIAVGDRGGRVVIFEQGRESKNESSYYKFYAEFQSHEPEFDYLKSLEIEEKINTIQWCPRTNNSHYLLASNDKTIKLWKVHEKKLRQSVPSSGEGIRFPQYKTTETITSASPRKVFSNAHAYHINSISVNSDSETFISVDDLRINLWNLEISDRCFNIVDIKPENMEELSEVITCAAFHPIHCNIFSYCSSKGTIKLNDTRQNALCDASSKVFEQPEDPSNKSFFSEIISSISDCKFSRDGRYLVSRDYMTLKLWDLNMETSPVKTIKIHEHIRSKLCDLYENDCIFDKFEVSLSADARKLVTGSYNNMFYVYDIVDDTISSIEANKNYPATNLRTEPLQQRRKVTADSLDFSSYNKRCLQVALHPKENIIAVGANNNLFLYEGPQSL